jgi:hypothetical protein
MIDSFQLPVSSFQLVFQLVTSEEILVTGSWQPARLKSGMIDRVPVAGFQLPGGFQLVTSEEILATGYWLLATP